MSTGRFRLSKSKIAAFEQCPKRLWLQVHKPDEAELDGSMQAAFATGLQVGALACDLVPYGVMVEIDPDIPAALRQTAELLASDQRRPIFEATFVHENVLVRVDILEPAQGGGWHVAEVKSTTSGKAYQLSDLATQVWVMKGAGVEIASASIRHIDRQFIYRGDGDYRGLLMDAAADHVIEPIVATRAEIAARAQETVEGPEPERAVGDHCTDPFDCPFQSYCRRGTTDLEWPISLLPNTGRKLAKQWGEKGIAELGGLAEDDLGHPLHKRIHRATLSSVAYHDAAGARAATAGWAYPRAWLDFETIAFAVPRWAGTHPYEQAPFQFSLHIEQADGSLSHHDFLSLDGSDPRRACAEALIDLVPPGGAVVAYNAAFERTCIRRLAELFPDLSDVLLGIAGRLIDLQPVAKAHWYHRDQRGSWSIKAVLPTIGGPGYDELQVGDGVAAQRAYLVATDPETPPQQKAELDLALRAYCARDTEAMVRLFNRLTTA